MNPFRDKNQIRFSDKGLLRTFPQKLTKTLCKAFGVVDLGGPFLMVS